PSWSEAPNRGVSARGCRPAGRRRRRSQQERRRRRGRGTAWGISGRQDDRPPVYATARPGASVPSSAAVKDVCSTVAAHHPPRNPRMNASKILICMFAMLAAIAPSAAEEPAWQAMLGDLPKTERAGFGGLCGFCIDRKTGDVIVNISDRGFYRSTDGAKTFQRISNSQPKGRTEEPGCFRIDPTGTSQTSASAIVYR